MQIPAEAPEGSVRFRWVPVGSGGFRCRYLVRFRRVPVQIPREVSEKIPAEAPRRVLCGSGGFRWVPAQIPCEVPGVSCAATR